MSEVSEILLRLSLSLSLFIRLNLIPSIFQSRSAPVRLEVVEVFGSPPPFSTSLLSDSVIWMELGRAFQFRRIIVTNLALTISTARESQSRSKASFSLTRSPPAYEWMRMSEWLTVPVIIVKPQTRGRSGDWKPDDETSAAEKVNLLFLPAAKLQRALLLLTVIFIP